MSPASARHVTARRRAGSERVGGHPREADEERGRGRQDCLHAATFCVAGVRTTSEQQHRRDERERRADAERHRRAEELPQHAEHDAGRQRADAAHRVVDAERRPALRRRREVGDERLLGPFRKPEIEAIDDEPAEQRRQRLAEREAGVDDGVDEPADGDDGAPADAVRPAAADHRHGRFHHVNARPHQRHEARAAGRVGQPQQQERVGRIAEHEDREDADEHVERPRQGLVGSRGARGSGGARGFLADPSSGMKKIRITAIAPGTIVSMNSVRYCPGQNTRNSVASAGPTTAPRLSIP